MVDLEKLEALHAASTPGEWLQVDGDDCLYATEELYESRIPMAHFMRRRDRKIIVSIHNDFTSIAAEIRELRAVVEQARVALEIAKFYGDTAHFRLKRNEALESIAGLLRREDVK